MALAFVASFSAVSVVPSCGVIWTCACVAVVRLPAATVSSLRLVSPVCRAFLVSPRVVIFLRPAEVLVVVPVAIVRVVTVSVVVVAQMVSVPGQQEY